MKESIGEANLTVITIILIGTIIPIAALIVPRILSSMQDRSCCLSNNGKIQNTNQGMRCVIPTGYNNKTKNEIFVFEPLRNFNEHCE